MSIRFKNTFPFHMENLVLVVTGILLQQFFSSIYSDWVSVTIPMKNEKSRYMSHNVLMTQYAHIPILIGLTVCANYLAKNLYR